MWNKLAAALHSAANAAKTEYALLSEIRQKQTKGKMITNVGL